MASRNLLSVTVSVAAAWFVAMLPALLAQDAPKSKPKNAKDVFATTNFWQVHLSLSKSEYDAMQPRGGGFSALFGAKPKIDPDRQVHRNTFGLDLPWATATVIVDGETFADIGIRYKGNGSIADASKTIKKSFKIDLDYFGGTKRYQGLKTLNLHCGISDPSRCRETLGYALYRAAGVPASRTAFAEATLTVPGQFDKELLGIYTAVEHVNKPFLRTHFGTDEGLLMKPEGVREIEYRGEAWEPYKKRVQPKREPTKAESDRVIAFARLIHSTDDATFRKEIAAFLDIDAYLRFLAATAYVANLDSFFSTGHNYYLYLHPKTNKFHFFPWDLDRGLANLPFLGSAEQQMDLSFTHPYMGANRLNDRLLAMPDVNARYDKLLKDLAADRFAKANVLKMVETIEAAVHDLVARDAKASLTRKEKGPGPSPFSGKVPTLLTFVEKRSQSMANQIDGKSKGFVPTGIFFNDPPKKNAK